MWSLIREWPALEADHSDSHDGNERVGDQGRAEHLDDFRLAYGEDAGTSAVVVVVVK